MSFGRGMCTAGALVSALAAAPRGEPFVDHGLSRFVPQRDLLRLEFNEDLALRARQHLAGSARVLANSRALLADMQVGR